MHPLQRLLALVESIVQNIKCQKLRVFLFFGESCLRKIFDKFHVYLNASAAVALYFYICICNCILYLYFCISKNWLVWMHLLQWFFISGSGLKFVEFAINTHSGDIINKIVKFWKKLSLLSKKATLKCQCEHHFVKIWAKKFWMLHSANWGQRRRNLYKRTCKSLFPFPAKIPSKEKKGKLIFNTSSKVRLSLQIWWNCLELHTLLKKRKSFLKCLYPTLQSAPVTTRQGKTAPNWAGVGRRINLLLLNFSSQEHTMKNLIKKKSLQYLKSSHGFKN